MPSRTGTCNQRSITASTNYEGANGISTTTSTARYCKLTNLAEGDKSRIFKRINKVVMGLSVSQVDLNRLIWNSLIIYLIKYFKRG